jgi:hypothetical protein
VFATDDVPTGALNVPVNVAGALEVRARVSVLTGLACGVGDTEWGLLVFGERVRH